MKTISQIQQEVLATAQVTLDELQASIEKFWEQGWERNVSDKQSWILAVAAVENNITL